MLSCRQVEVENGVDVGPSKGVPGRGGVPVGRQVDDDVGAFEPIRPRAIQLPEVGLLDLRIAAGVDVEQPQVVPAAGEQVRWLPRRESSDLLLPGNDCWVFDNQRVQFNYFSGIGDFLAAELSDDPVVVKQCAAAFETVWERAVPHGQYQLR